MADYYVDRPEFLVKLPPGFRAVGVLLEPLSIVEKAIVQSFAVQRRLRWEPKRALVLGARADRTPGRPGVRDAPGPGCHRRR